MLIPCDDSIVKSAEMCPVQLTLNNISMYLRYDIV